MKIRNAKKKPVKVRVPLPARLPAGKLDPNKPKPRIVVVNRKLPHDVAEVVKRAMAQAEDIINDPILKLQRSRVADINFTDPQAVFSYLMAHDYIPQSQISIRTYAMLIAVLSHKIYCAFQQRSLRFPELGKDLFNSDSSELVTPPEVLKLPEGLSASSPIYFQFDLGTNAAKGDILAGDFLIISTGGMYRWIYSCSGRHPKTTWWKNVPKRIVSKKRILVTESTFESVGIDGMLNLISQKKIEPLAFLYRLRDTLIVMDNEVSRVHGNIKSALEFAHGLLYRIYRTS